MGKNEMTLEQKIEAERIINMMWRVLVEGFQKIDPTLATKWGARQPEGFVDAKTGNPGFSMFCDNLLTSFLVEYNTATMVYLLTAVQGERNAVHIPITAVLDAKEMAPTLVEWVKDHLG